MCGSRDNCGVIATADDSPICNCFRDCYEYGDCCTDVSHVANCIGILYIVHVRQSEYGNSLKHRVQAVKCYHKGNLLTCCVFMHFLLLCIHALPPVVYLYS